jgi:hexosaminidase
MIIPLPLRCEPHSGKYLLTSETFIQTDSANQWNAEFLQKLISPPTGFRLRIEINDLAENNVIHLRLNPSLEILGREGYQLEVRIDGIMIAAPEISGIFYGIQTLRQLLPTEIEQRFPVSTITWSIPCIFIEDKPRFPWRGFMLDEGRHFQGKEILHLTLDLMAMQKLNVLHWHLTEDQGWRIEIKKYPKLTEVGSRRAGTSKSMLGKRHDGIPHAGYYTQDEIREIEVYAARRHITIVPEIEMPGHARAALAAYPDLACTAGPFKVATHFGIFSDILCPGKESVFSFIENVLDEVLDIFPSPFIHIGGDEAPKKHWRECPNCQRRIREERLNNVKALQVYFTNRIAAYLESKGRQGMGWNDILQDGLGRGMAVQFWARGRKRLLNAIRNEKRPVVMSTFLDTYLDHSYSVMPLSRAYKYEPIPIELKENEAESILGLEFPLWSEWVPDRARLDYQVYPRLTAMAETGWTPNAKKNFNDFNRRLENFLGRLDCIGVRYAPLNEAEPEKVRLLSGIFSILQPQDGSVK